MRTPTLALVTTPARSSLSTATFCCRAVAVPSASVTPATTDCGKSDCRCARAVHELLTSENVWLRACILLALLARWGPRPVGHWHSLQAFRVEDGVLDALALPGISHVDQAIRRLNDRWIGVFARLALEHQRGRPQFAVARERDVQWRPALRCVVVDDEVPAVGERDGVGAGARVRQARSSSPPTSSCHRPRTTSRRHARTGTFPPPAAGLSDERGCSAGWRRWRGLQRDGQSSMSCRHPCSARSAPAICSAALSTRCSSGSGASRRRAGPACS